MTDLQLQGISPEHSTDLPNGDPCGAGAPEPAKTPEDEHSSALQAHYHSLKKIGHGAQATMFKALDAHNHPVAIKIFDIKKANDWKDIELFEREVDVLKDLKIKGVPGYIETIKTDSAIYLVE
jgi:serine/threonine protein kinase